ncbi:hypothetical protein ACFQ3Z_46240 [Streptomyces nogalater]
MADGTESDGSLVVNTAEPQETDPADTGVVDIPADKVNVEPDIPSSGGDHSKNEPDRVDCNVYNYYTPSYKGGDHHKGVGPKLGNTNNTSHTATSKFTSEVTGSVGVSISGSLAVSVEAMIAKIEAKYDVTLSASMTAKLGNEMSVPTPAHKTTHAAYGVYRLRNQGTSWRQLESCKTTPKVTVTSYTPDYVGWYIWETNA